MMAQNTFHDNEHVRLGFPAHTAALLAVPSAFVESLASGEVDCCAVHYCCAVQGILGARGGNG